MNYGPVWSRHAHALRRRIEGSASVILEDSGQADKVNPRRKVRGGFANYRHVIGRTDDSPLPVSSDIVSLTIFQQPARKALSRGQLRPGYARDACCSNQNILDWIGVGWR